MRNLTISAFALALLAAAACGDDESATTSSTGGSGTSTTTTSTTTTSTANGGNGGGQTVGPGGGASVGGAGTGGAGGGGGGLTCFDFSNDPGIPLAIDGTFDAMSPTWRRPHDDDPICPATAFTPNNVDEVPFVAYAFCNNDNVAHTYTFEMIGDDSDPVAPAMPDPYMFLYNGQQIPADALQCLHVNDDIPGSVMTGDSEIADVVVQPGEAITMVGTAFRTANDDAYGYYIMVVSNVD